MSQNRTAPTVAATSPLNRGNDGNENTERSLIIYNNNGSRINNGNGVAADSSPTLPPANGHRLRLHPDSCHSPSSYEDLQLDFSPLLYSSLERYLPPPVVNAPRDRKIHYIQDILGRYFPAGERNRVQVHREYKRQIMSNYQPLYRELYSLSPTDFFVPSFIEAFRTNSEESFRNILDERSPGIFTFQMLQPRFCHMLMAEVENFERWVHETKFRIMRPSTINKYGVVLDDFGMEPMLAQLMEDFISPMTKFLFPEYGGSSLDTHHGFVVEYGTDRDSDLGFHIDDSEITLNVCMGSQFSGGDLFFRGLRCQKHVTSMTYTEEMVDYSQVPGTAILHRGCHRHGARATISGHRMNLLLWCRSSAFREMRKYRNDFSACCRNCKDEKKARQRQSIEAAKEELLKRSEAAA